MKFNPDPSILSELLSLDEATGILYWKKREPKWFVGGVRPVEKRAQSWNSRYEDKEAFSSNSSQGYKQGSLLGKAAKAHHIIWAMVKGYWSTKEIDHIDGNRSNNKIENLREVTSAENSRNRKLTDKNTSGVVGVYNRHDKWYATIFKSVGERVALGTFTTFEQAVLARKSAEVLFGYHKNHGRLLCE